jgi:hypothetical protein
MDDGIALIEPTASAGLLDIERCASTIVQPIRVARMRGRDESGQAWVADSEQTKPKMRKLCRSGRVCWRLARGETRIFCKTKPRIRRLHNLH